VESWLGIARDVDVGFAIEEGLEDNVVPRCINYIGKVLIEKEISHLLWLW
jgi:hypothetical protein